MPDRPSAPDERFAPGSESHDPSELDADVAAREHSCHELQQDHSPSKRDASGLGTSSDEERESPLLVGTRAAHLDSILDVRSVTPGQDSQQDTATSPGTGLATGPLKGAEGPRLARDQAVLLRIADLKYLTTEQLHRSLFRTTDITVARRCVRRLAREQWVELWQPPAILGSSPKVAIPTRRALRFALEVKRGLARGSELEQLASTLIPTTTRAPVQRRPDAAPPFFAHQREVNDILLAIDRLRVPILWSTSWDRPLPPTLGLRGFKPPQPDAIVVVRYPDGAPTLLFIEHDRGTQHGPAFTSGKGRYAGLALRPELLIDAFGITRFRVLVTVSCADIPGRIAFLRRLARAGGYAERLLFYDARVFASR
jgi:hypothetical protein